MPKGGANMGKPANPNGARGGNRNLGWWAKKSLGSKSVGGLGKSGWAKDNRGLGLALRLSFSLEEASSLVISSEPFSVFLVLGVAARSFCSDDGGGVEEKSELESPGSMKESGVSALSWGSLNDVEPSTPGETGGVLDGEFLSAFCNLLHKIVLYYMNNNLNV